MLINQIGFLLTCLVLLPIALLLLIPIAVLLIECMAALLPDRRKESPAVNTPIFKFAVLIPAHNEASGIRPVLEKLVPQLNPQDRLVVIADNCTDETAVIARQTGATVIERQDADRRGKGYALDYGLRFLSESPPDVVVLVDADCMVPAGGLEQLSRRAMLTQRPVQALYLMERPAQPKPKDAVSALAFLFKNLVRPQGLYNLGLPCLLTGTGVAFPWRATQAVQFASGNIVEDMQLGIDLTRSGYPPLFDAHVRVMGLLPQQEQAAKSQRTRWEHGHLRTIQTQALPLLKEAIVRGRLDLLAIALDLSVPPLSLLVMLWIAGMALTVAAGVLGITWLPAAWVALEGLFLLGAIGMGWVKFGRTELPAQALLAIPLYVLWKIPLYFAFLIKPQTKWVRTERDGIDTPLAK